MASLEFDETFENFIDPVLRLWRGEGDMKENLQDLMPILEETGRQIFTNGSITVNLWPIILGGIALGLLLLKLFFGLTLFDVMDAMTGNSYGSPYATTATGYAAPAATSSYGTPSTGYDAHTSYSARTSFYDEEDVQLTPEQKALYPELAKLQDDINQLKENEIRLRSQIFYNNAESDLTNAGTSQIGYSY